MAYRTMLVQLWLTPKEKEKLQEDAKKEQLTMSEYIRKKCKL